MGRDLDRLDMSAIRAAQSFFVGPKSPALTLWALTLTCNAVVRIFRREMPIPSLLLCPIGDLLSVHVQSILQTPCQQSTRLLDQETNSLSH